MRFHVVVNPVAGSGRAGPLADRLAERLTAAGHGVTLHRTRHAGDGAAHVGALAADAADRLVVLGGDGTLREVLNARPLPLPWPVGLVALGTANVVARELKMPLRGDPERRAQALLAAEPWEVDLIEVLRPDGSRECALANVSAGLDAEIVHAVTRARAERRGSGGYGVWVAPILSTLRTSRRPALEVTLDGGRVRTGSAVIVQGARCYGGLFTLAPGAALDAGTLFVSVVEGRRKRDWLRIFVRAGLGRAALDRGLRTERAHEVRITSAVPAALQADGDPCGTTDVTLRHLPRALTLLRAH